MLAHEILIRPIVSEKSTAGISSLKYTFEVARNATKVDIKRAIKEVFGAEALKVNTSNVRGRKRRKGRTEGFTSAWKKAVVTLKSDSKGIEFCDTMI